MGDKYMLLQCQLHTIRESSNVRKRATVLGWATNLPYLG